MKTIACLFSVLALAGCTSADVYEPSVSAPPPPPPAASPEVAPSPAAGATLFTQDQLDLLLGPIALYPDPLLALILPSSTTPSDIVLASRYLAAGGDANQVDAQPWDDSVRSLAHFPQVIRWMDQNLAWTKQLGEAFVNQPDDVMASVQRLRQRARAAGTLTSTPQQRVAYDGQTVTILPEQPDVIYIPYYDPSVVYTAPRTYYYDSTPSSYFGFSSGFVTGWWMSYGLDWPGRRVWCVEPRDRDRYWREHHGDWHRRPDVAQGPSAPPVRTWTPHDDAGRRHDGPRAPGFAGHGPDPRHRPDNDHDRNAPNRPDHRPQPTDNRPGYVSNRPAPRPQPATAMTPAPGERRRDWREESRVVPSAVDANAAARITPRPYNPPATYNPPPAVYTPPAAYNPPAPVSAPPPAMQPESQRRRGPGPGAGEVHAAPPPRFQPPTPVPEYHAPPQRFEPPRPAPTPAAPPAYTPPPAPPPQAAPPPASTNNNNNNNNSGQGGDDDRHRQVFIRR